MTQTTTPKNSLKNLVGLLEPLTNNSNLMTYKDLRKQFEQLSSELDVPLQQLERTIAAIGEAIAKSETQEANKEEWTDEDVSVIERAAPSASVEEHDSPETLPYEEFTRRVEESQPYP